MCATCINDLNYQWYSFPRAGWQSNPTPLCKVLESIVWVDKFSTEKFVHGLYHLFTPFHTCVKVAHDTGASVYFMPAVSAKISKRTTKYGSQIWHSFPPPSLLSKHESGVQQPTGLDSRRVVIQFFGRVGHPQAKVAFGQVRPRDGHVLPQLPDGVAVVQGNNKPGAVVQPDLDGRLGCVGGNLQQKKKK
jgi:hypothetical protein